MALRQVKAADLGRSITPVKVEKASAVTGSIVSMPGPGQVVWSTRNYHGFAKEGYVANAEANACINLYSSAVKGIEFKVYQKQKNGKRKALDRHSLLDLLKHPNDEMSGSSFFEGWTTYLLCAGNAYVERVGPRPGAPPRELYLQRPDRMKVIAGNAVQQVGGYQYQAWYRTDATPWYPEMIRVNGKQRFIHRILHSKFFNPIDDWYGLSALEVAGRSIDQINAAQAWNVSLLQNGARPSGLLTIENLDDEQRALIEDKFQIKHSGPANVGKTIIASGGDMSYTKISTTAQEMDWLAGQALATERICSVLRVPVELINQGGHRTFQNWAEARLSFYMEGVMPLVNFMLSEMNYWLQPFFGEDVEIGYDPEEIEALQENKQYIATRALDGFRAGAITRNMYLTAIGQDALTPEIGDVFLVPTNVIEVPLNGQPRQPARLNPSAPADKPALPAASESNGANPGRLAIVPRRNT